MKNLVLNILKSKSLKDEQKAVECLFNYYNTLSNQLLLRDFFLNNATEVNGGMALSPQHAIDCINDYVRTARFIKGIYRAILDLKNKKQAITILYAGSGPYGTLLVPLLPLFNSDDIQVTFLDIHESSIASVKTIINFLSYDKCVKEYLVCDASNFQAQIKDCFQLIISETMDVALTKEPQVVITKSLQPLLCTHGILIPEEITLTTRHSFFSKEPKFKEKEGVCKGVLNTIEKSTLLFSITKDTIFENNNAFCFDSETIEKGTIDANTPDICINTNIKIYSGIKLNAGESLITNPYCVSSLYSVKERSYKLRYTTENIPNWTLIQEDS
ncbi:hypothetical protein N7U66_14480 [Lacinutrix neustonica]|uniref:Phytanoyl-CoA dioxygenase n=1 Tax=Lacinutrix neustonica TaxID=2980107 RepID=A0A9E8SCH3_9FLAO|nr:hypothetical protein [Lacinutrix neustonica]WAC01293.1 hypothetical protein N7U66_14480 [Lacinutrix neustonica]